MRITLRHLGAQANPAKLLFDTHLAVAPGHPPGLQAQRLADDVAHQHPGSRDPAGSWNTIETLLLCRCICRLDRWVTSAPPIRTMPDVGSRSRTMHRPTVDLPEPLSPTSAIT